ncbi:MAG: heavy-metal-associated domain-containing protein [Candidatus Adiutrix sp.]|jgi:mercuric ion binding protein|nr:heavy-metal-associated domain-containing protein [Candidatus Adiutrix sp.]
MNKYLWLVFLLMFPASAEAGNISVIIDVEGMSCSLCVTAINQELRKTGGVIKAKTSLKTRQAEVVVSEDFPTQLLLEAVAKTGYVGKIADIRRIPE